MDGIRWGIIGVGAVTEVKSGPGLQQAEGSSLVAVMRRDGAKAADYARLTREVHALFEGREDHLGYREALQQTWLAEDVWPRLT